MNNELFSRLKDLETAVGAVHPFRENCRSKRRPGG